MMTDLKIIIYLMKDFLMIKLWRKKKMIVMKMMEKIGIKIEINYDLSLGFNFYLFIFTLFTCLQDQICCFFIYVKHFLIHLSIVDCQCRMDYYYKIKYDMAFPNANKILQFTPNQSWKHGLWIRSFYFLQHWKFKLSCLKIEKKKSKCRVNKKQKAYWII